MERWWWASENVQNIWLLRWYKTKNMYTRKSYYIWDNFLIRDIHRKNRKYWKMTVLKRYYYYYLFFLVHTKFVGVNLVLSKKWKLSLLYQKIVFFSSLSLSPLFFIAHHRITNFLLTFILEPLEENILVIQFWCYSTNSTKKGGPSFLATFIFIDCHGLVFLRCLLLLN